MRARQARPGRPGPDDAPRAGRVRSTPDRRRNVYALRISVADRAEGAGENGVPSGVEWAGPDASSGPGPGSHDRYDPPPAHCPRLRRKRFEVGTVTPSRCAQVVKIPARRTILILPSLSTGISESSPVERRPPPLPRARAPNAAQARSWHEDHAAPTGHGGAPGYESRRPSCAPPPELYHDACSTVGRGQGTAAAHAVPGRFCLLLAHQVGSVACNAASRSLACRQSYARRPEALEFHSFAFVHSLRIRRRVWPLGQY